MNSEDQKEFKGFDGSNVDDSVTAEKVPCFALMYKFRKEYVDVSVDSVMADHKGHCAKFKRLLSNQLAEPKKINAVGQNTAALFPSVLSSESLLLILRYVGAHNWEIIWHCSK